MTRLVVRGARYPGDIAVEDGVITAVGTVEALPGDEVLAVDGDIATAGLVNTHHHLYQWMTRGRATGCNLFEWLVHLYPIWNRLSVEDVRAAALVGLGELAASGCTTASDHHYLVPGGDDSVFDAIADAAGEVGIRLFLSRGSMDLGESRGGLPPDRVVEDRDAILASTEAVAARHHDGDMVHVVVAPCSPFSVTTELMVESAELARKLGLRLHTHLCETVEEQQHCLERFGRRPVEMLEEWGWVGDDVWLAHGIHIDDAEMRILGNAGTGVAHCPSSNARIASGMCRVTDLIAAGCPVGLGVDGGGVQRGGQPLPRTAPSPVYGSAPGDEARCPHAVRRPRDRHARGCPVPRPRRRGAPVTGNAGRPGGLAGRRPRRRPRPACRPGARPGPPGPPRAGWREAGGCRRFAPRRRPGGRPQRTCQTREAALVSGTDVVGP